MFQRALNPAAIRKIEAHAGLCGLLHRQARFSFNDLLTVPRQHLERRAMFVQLARCALRAVREVDQRIT